MAWTWLSRWRDARERRREIALEREERREARRRLLRSEDQVSSLAVSSQALGGALAKTFEMQAQLLEGTSRFLGVMQDLSAKKAAQVMGSRGGKANAARKAKRLNSPPECELCRNPAFRHPTWDMISEHRKHEITEPQMTTANGQAP